ncbi:hypothetical protein PM082_006940 [Marasmius tenuissimus]|nr:hypothetical protein PM082_006940 [Marasmius tenuissimus]
MNAQNQWHECLRLQGKAEAQWLRLCGYPAEDIPALVEERRVFRQYTIKRYGRMIDTRVEFRDKMCRRARSCAQKLSEVTVKRKDIPKLTQLKEHFEEQHDEAQANIIFLFGAIDRLKAPTLIITRKKKVHATPEVEALVLFMVDAVAKGRV